MEITPTFQLIPVNSSHSQYKLGAHVQVYDYILKCPYKFCLNNCHKMLMTVCFIFKLITAKSIHREELRNTKITGYRIESIC